jgi:glycosyltransferase involved in cell wall biosynthesis
MATPPVSIVLIAGEDPSGFSAALESARGQVDGAELLAAGAVTSGPVADAIAPLGGEVRAVAAEGAAAARNAGVTAARGEFVVVLDGHERLASGALARHLEGLRGEPQRVASYGRVAIHRGRVRIRPEQGKGGHVLGRLLKDRHLIPAAGALVWRRAALGEAPFDPAYSSSAALRLDLALKLSRLDGGFVFHPVVVAEREPEEQGLTELEELVKVFLGILYGPEALSESREQRARFRLARQLVAMGKHHYRAGDHKRAGRFFDEAVKAAPGYFRGRRYQFLNFVRNTLSRG